MVCGPPRVYGIDLPSPVFLSPALFEVSSNDGADDDWGVGNSDFGMRNAEWGMGNEKAKTRDELGWGALPGGGVGAAYFWTKAP